MQGTPIQWCDDTVNPVMGCGGCELAMPAYSKGQNTCYAWKMHQFRGGNKGWANNFFQPEMFSGRLGKAARWRDLTGTNRLGKSWLDGLPRTIFVSDLGDALSESIPFDFLKTEIIDVAMGEGAHHKSYGAIHQWLWLTKRPGRMADFSKWLLQQFGIEWPRNVWAGTSVTSTKTVGRLNHLMKVGNSNTLRFVSVEPLWEEVSLAKYLQLRSSNWWVITGGESRQNKATPPRRFELNWARKLRDECQKYNTPFFVKQLGAYITDHGQILDLGNSHGGDWSEWPKDIRVREMPDVQ